MDRLAQLQHHVVGDVDDVADRPRPPAAQAQPHPQGRGSDGHPVDLTGGEPRAALRILDPHGDPRCARSRHGGSRHGVQWNVVEGGQVAGHAVDRHGVGAVGGDCHVEHHVGEGNLIRERPPRERLVEHQDAAPLVAEAELALRSRSSRENGHRGCCAPPLRGPRRAPIPRWRRPRWHRPRSSTPRRRPPCPRPRRRWSPAGPGRPTGGNGSPRPGRRPRPRTAASRRCTSSTSIPTPLNTDATCSGSVVGRSMNSPSQRSETLIGTAPAP